MINDVFRDMLDVGVIAYMDAILMYSEIIEAHVAMLRKVMDRLRKAGLCVSLKKSTFHAREVQFLGYKISDGGISMTTKKVEEIMAWLPPQRWLMCKALWALPILTIGLLRDLGR